MNKVGLWHVIGVDLLVPASGSAGEEGTKTVLLCEIKAHKARGYRIPNGFLVLKGSEAVTHDRASSEKWPWPCNMRKALKADGALIEEGDRLVFTRDFEFASPSAAAAVVHGGHANGLIAWKTSDGRTLKDIESF
jgi:hypothetical protein